MLGQIHFTERALANDFHELEILRHQLAGHHDWALTLTLLVALIALVSVAYVVVVVASVALVVLLSLLLLLLLLSLLSLLPFNWFLVYHERYKL